MNCKECGSKTKKFGKDRNGNQRFRCTKCGKTLVENRSHLVAGMTIPENKMIQALSLLCEGMSLRATARVTGIYRGSIMKLLSIVGTACEVFSEKTIKGIPVGDVQCDEVWAFVGAKEKNKKRTGKIDYAQGDAWTYTAIERNSKLILCWHLGRRTSFDTYAFTNKLDAATSGHFQVTTDGFKAYIDAMSFTVGGRVDFAQLVKIYKKSADGERRYSPAECTDAIKLPIYGNPDPAKISTSHVERQNLSMRMGNRRMTRLTNAFSKKWSMFRASLGLYFAHYNFCRVHQTLRVTPAMEAGITDHVWTLKELIQASN